MELEKIKVRATGGSLGRCGPPAPYGGRVRPGPDVTGRGCPRATLLTRRPAQPTLASR
jgi:hypothetical protein